MILALALSFIFSCAPSKPPLKAIDVQMLQLFEKDSLTIQGWNALWRNEFPRAIQLFKAALEKNPDNVSALRGNGLAKFSYADEAGAEESLYHAALLTSREAIAVSLRDFIGRMLPDRKSKIDNIFTLDELMSAGDAPLAVRREGNIHLAFNLLVRYKKEKRADEATGRLKWITDWQVIGPFPNQSRSGFNRSFFNEEALADSQQQCDLMNGTFTGKNNRLINWFRPSRISRQHDVPISSYIGYSSYSASYAFKEIEIKIEGDYALVFSQTGAIKSWLDGQLILSDDKYRLVYENRWLICKLTAGRHTILVKTCNETENMEFSLAIEPLTPQEKSQIEDLGESPFYQKLFPAKKEFAEAPDPNLSALCARIDAHPEQIENYFWLAFSLGEKDYGQEGVRVLDEAIQIMRVDKDSVNLESSLIYFLKYWCLGTYGKDREARNALRECYKLSPTFFPGVANEIKDQIEEKNFTLAESELNKMLEINPKWYRGLYLKFNMLMARERPSDAWLVADDLLELYPDAPDVHLLQALKAVAFKDDQHVETSMRNVKKNGNAVVGDIFMLERAFDKEDYMKAFNIASGLAKLLPALPKYCVDREKAQFRLGVDEASEAAEECCDLLKSFNDNKDILQLLANYHEKKVYVLKSVLKNREIMAKLSSEAKQKLDSLRKAEISTLEEILVRQLKLSPADYDLRLKIQTLKNSKSFDELFDQFDSQDLIALFESTEGFSPSDYVIVLDDQIILCFDDGAQRQLGHQILKVLSEKGVELCTNQTVPYNRLTGAADILKAQVIKPDGSKIEAMTSGRRVAFVGLEKGDYIELKYAYNFYQSGMLSRDFWTSFAFDGTAPVFKTRLCLAFPGNSLLTTRFYGPKKDQILKHTKTFWSGFQLITYEAENLPAIDIHSYAPDMRDVATWIDISTISDWKKIRDWYADLSQGQFEVTPAIEAKAAQLTEGLTTPKERLEVIREFVTEKIKYEDLNFQYSAFIPQRAEDVLEDGFGDCKDKCSLLIALFKAVGIESVIALNEPNYIGEKFFLPSNRFEHTVVLIPHQNDDGFDVIDPTAENTSLSDIPLALSGTYILPIDPSGRLNPELHRISEDIDQRPTTIDIRVKVSVDETAITGNILARGFHAKLFRDLLETENVKAQKLNFVTILNNYIPGIEVDAFWVANIDNLKEDVMIGFQGRSPTSLIRYSSKLTAVKITRLFDARSHLDIGAESGFRNVPVLINQTLFRTPIRETITIETPATYNLESLPSEQIFKFENARVKYSYSNKGNAIECRREIIIPKIQVSSLSYSDMKKFSLDVLHAEEESPLFRQ